MYRVAIDEFRRAPIRRFPFEIFYELTGNSITIYSVFTANKIRKSGASVSVIEPHPPKYFGSQPEGLKSIAWKPLEL
jgi:hypothetical protein